MANLFSIQVLQMPDQTDFAGQTNPCPAHGISPTKIQDVRPATANEISAYPAALTAIEVAYYNNSQVYTGNYLTGSTVAQVITAANAALT